jgi:hypothetical protein
MRLWAVAFAICAATPSAAFSAASAKAFPRVAAPRASLAVRLPSLHMNGAKPAARPPYVLTGLPRPEWRGKMMGWLHATRAWYIITIAYFIACYKIPTAFPLSGRELLLRLFASLASSANVLISDGYHNGDKRGAIAYNAEAETAWLRWDYLGISSVLTSLLWLWSSNVGMGGRLPSVCLAGGVCTALVAALSAFVVPRKVGHTAVKLVLASQFVGLLGYLVTIAAAGACNVSSSLSVEQRTASYSCSPVFPWHPYCASRVTGTFAFLCASVFR